MSAPSRKETPDDIHVKPDTDFQLEILLNCWDLCKTFSKSDILPNSNGFGMCAGGDIELTEKLTLTMFLTRQTKTPFAWEAGGNAR